MVFESVIFSPFVYRISRLTLTARNCNVYEHTVALPRPEVRVPTRVWSLSLADRLRLHCGKLQRHLLGGHGGDGGRVAR